MGIRYYAYPIDADDYEQAVIDPCAFHGRDPLADAWQLNGREKPEMLYLDKAWGELQLLLGAEEPGGRRAAYELVAGNVTHTSDGWIPHEAALSPDRVREIAADLATVGDADIRELHQRSGKWWPRDTPEEGFKLLADAREFVWKLAGNGRGLVYMIG